MPRGSSSVWELERICCDRLSVLLSAEEQDFKRRWVLLFCCIRWCALVYVCVHEVTNALARVCSYIVCCGHVGYTAGNPYTPTCSCGLLLATLHSSLLCNDSFSLLVTLVFTNFPLGGHNTSLFFGSCLCPTWTILSHAQTFGVNSIYIYIYIYFFVPLFFSCSWYPPFLLVQFCSSGPHLAGTCTAVQMSMGDLNLGLEHYGWNC